MLEKLNSLEEAFFKNILRASNGNLQMQEVKPETLLDENGNKLLTGEQEKNFDVFIDALHKKGFINKLDDMRTLSDVTGCYYFSISPDGITYFEDIENSIKERKKEKKSDRKHDLFMVLIGAFIGLIPFFITSVIPWIIALFEK